MYFSRDQESIVPIYPAFPQTLYLHAYVTIDSTSSPQFQLLKAVCVLRSESATVAMLSTV